MASNTDDMLAKAHLFFTCAPKVEKMPDTFADEDDAISHLISSLLFEANHCMQEKIDMPDQPIMNAVDLESDEPGIIEGVEGSQVKIARSKHINIPEIVYERRALKTVDESKITKIPPGKIDKLLHDADRQMHVAFEREQKREVNKVLAQRVRKEQQLKKRAEKNNANQASDAADELNEAVNGKKSDDDDESPRMNDREANNGHTQEEAAKPTKPEGKEKKKEDVEKKIKEPPKQVLPTDMDIEYASSNDSIKRQKSNKNCITVYESPIPHDRHLTALTNCAIHPGLRASLLRGEASSQIKAVQGPPGTGKTTLLLNEVKSFIEAHPNLRVAICSPTNANAADLYHRALTMGIVGFLGLAKKNVPVGVPKRMLVNETTAKVIFCTISGRNGAKLKNQRVHAIFIDEAAMVPEALTWGLLREEVEYLFMVGDTRQLPAMVSKQGRVLRHDRSMLERLDHLGFPITMLHEQRRMHPEILKFPNDCFYDGKLSTHPATEAKRSEHAPYGVFHVDGEEVRVGTSYKNVKEALACISVAKTFTEGGLNVQILVPYVAQLNEMLALGCGIPVSTIDSFQGKEQDVVILCTVRTMSDGFWEDPRRLCVALTRARLVLRVIGNFSRSDGSLSMLSDDSKRRGLFETWS